MIITTIFGCLQGEETVRIEEINLPTPALQISPSLPKTTDDIEIIFFPYQLDNPNIELKKNYRWKAGDKEWELALLPAHFTSGGEIWSIDVWYSAGEIESPHVNYELQIQDTLSVLSLSISPQFPRSTEGISANFELNDPDIQISDIEYRWTRNGHPLTETDAFLPAERTTKGDQWTLAIYSINGEVLSQSPILHFAIRNAEPKLDGIALSPNPATGADTLSVNHTIVDPDDDPLEYEYRWFVNDTFINTNNSETFSMLPFERGDEVYAESRAFDGLEYSEWKRSIPVTIQNTPPEIQNVSISPENPASNQLVHCSYESYTDQEDDNDLSSIRWLKNGSVIGTTAFLDLSLLPIHPFDQLFCVVQAFDGFDDGNILSANVAVINTPPVTYTVDLTPGTAYKDSNLSCNPTNTVDIDGTTFFSYDYEWYVNGYEFIAYGGGSRPSIQGNTVGKIGSNETEAFSKGDVVVCAAIPNDQGPFYSGVGNPTYSNGLVIQNSLPTANSVEIQPATPSLSDIVTCEITNWQDADMDEDQTIFIWKKNGQFLQYGAVLNLQTAQATLADQFTCEAHLFDGEDYGAVLSAVISSQNTAPEILSITLEPEEPTSIDVIRALTVYYDADFDLVSLEYEWLRNGQTQNETSDSLAGPFEPGDTIVVQITPFDGISTGVTMQSGSVSIINSPPSAPEVALVETENGLECQEITPSVDIDEDQISQSSRWLCDGQDILHPDLDSASIMSEFLSTTYSYDTVPYELLSSCVLWKCGLTPNDGQDDGPEGTSPIFVYSP